VKVAADGFQDPDCEVRFMLSHRQVAKHLDAVGLPATYLASSIYMESLLPAAETIRADGTIFAPAGQGRIAFVAASDVAAVAAEVLTSPGHEDATYVVTGPEALGYSDVAARISAVFAREVDYVDQPREDAREMMLASGMSPWEADGMLEQFEWISEGGADSVTATVAEVTGTDPRPMEVWLADRRVDLPGAAPGPASADRLANTEQAATTAGSPRRLLPMESQLLLKIPIMAPCPALMSSRSEAFTPSPSRLQNVSTTARCSDQRNSAQLAESRLDAVTHGKTNASTRHA
jgi:hypothetical protein